MRKKDKDEAVEKEDKVNEKATTETPEKDAANEAQEEKEEKLSPEEEWELKYNALNDKYLRLYSEFENFRKRTIKEKSDLILNGGKSVIIDLLSVLDDFERAIANNASSDDVEVMKNGFQLIYNKISKSLTDKGLQPMDPKGKDFDAEEHEAVANFPAPTPKEKGKVIDVAEKGYYLNDKVLRHAKVIVGQ